jgi:hypothetical protein
LGCSITAFLPTSAFFLEAAKLQKVTLKLIAVIVYVFLGIFTDKEHLPDMRR